MLSDEYYKLHQQNLTPLKIKIDVDLFESQIKKYKFIQWGDKFNEYPRYGLPVVNQNGRMDNDPEPACWPLDRWNFLQKGYDNTPEKFNEFYSIAHTLELEDETKFTTPTEVLSISSLDVLNPIKPYLYRTCILRFDTMGHFKPHYDTWFPAKWLRIWGTTKPDGCVFRYEVDEPGRTWVESKGEYKKYVREQEIEPGRLYLHDSVKWHDVLAYDDDVYQFFIAINPKCHELLSSLRKS
mgnify:CR=1 FL=1